MRVWNCDAQCMSIGVFFSLVADRDDHIVQTGVTSVISMTVGLLALAACVILVAILVRCVSHVLR